MPTYTVDASVFLNAFNPYEEGHEESRRLLELLQQRAYPLAEPVLLLPELAATVARGRHDAKLALAFAGAVSRLPHMILVAMDSGLGWQAAEIASGARLRGSDAVYVAVASRFSATLVTLDREQLERARTIVSVCLPADALSQAI